MGRTIACETAISAHLAIESVECCSRAAVSLGLRRLRWVLLRGLFCVASPAGSTLLMDLLMDGTAQSVIHRYGPTRPLLAKTSCFESALSGTDRHSPIRPEKATHQPERSFDTRFVAIRLRFPPWPKWPGRCWTRSGRRAVPSGQPVHRRDRRLRPRVSRVPRCRTWPSSRYSFQCSPVARKPTSVTFKGLPSGPGSWRLRSIPLLPSLAIPG